MSRLGYFFKRLVKMDWKAMWKTTGLLRERSGKSRLWLMADMLRCAVKYNAGYIDYKIAQMYRLNDAQRATVITRGISNSIVRRMNDCLLYTSSGHIQHAQAGSIHAFSLQAFLQKDAIRSNGAGEICFLSSFR